MLCFYNIIDSAASTAYTMDSTAATGTLAATTPASTSVGGTVAGTSTLATISDCTVGIDTGVATSSASDASAATSTSTCITQKNSDVTHYKKFIFYFVDHDEVLLPMEFYSDLAPGLYIAVKFVNVRGVYMFWGKHRSKSGSYDDALLLYSKEQNRFIHLLPCYYTIKKMQELYDSAFLSRDLNVMILEKRPRKEGVRRPQSPLWRKGLLVEYFDTWVQFHLYHVFSDEDEDVGKVKKMVKKTGKQILSFYKYLLQM